MAKFRVVRIIRCAKMKRQRETERERFRQKKKKKKKKKGSEKGGSGTHVDMKR